MEPEDGNPYKWGIFYYDRSDRRAFVPKRYGMGWTLNFGSRWSYLVLAIILGLVVWDLSATVF